MPIRKDIHVHFMRQFETSHAAMNELRAYNLPIYSCNGVVPSGAFVKDAKGES